MSNYLFDIYHKKERENEQFYQFLSWVGIICHGEYSHGTHHLVLSAFSTNKMEPILKKKKKNPPTITY